MQSVLLKEGSIRKTMISPKELRDKAFKKSFGMGYKADDVHDFLGRVAVVLEELIEERDDLERKLEVLADKIGEYREDQESLRSALLGAQKLGDSVIRESKTKAEIIMRDANIKAEVMIDNAKRQLEKEQQAFDLLQTQVREFKSDLLKLYRQHIETVTTIPGETEELTAIESTSGKQLTGEPMEKLQPEPKAEPVAEPTAPMVETVTETVREQPKPQPAPEPPVQQFVPDPTDTRPLSEQLLGRSGESKPLVDGWPITTEETEQPIKTLEESVEDNIEDIIEDELVFGQMPSLIPKSTPETAEESEPYTEAPEDPTPPKFSSLKFGEAFSMSQGDGVSGKPK